MVVADLDCRTVLTNSIERHRDLLEADSPVLLHLPSALTSVYCDDVANRLRLLPFEPYKASVGSHEVAPIPKLGCALFEYHKEILLNRNKALSAYFEQSANDAALLRRLFRDSRMPNPLDVLHYVVYVLFGEPVSVVTEGGHPYFSGLVRDMGSGLLT